MDFQKPHDISSVVEDIIEMVPGVKQLIFKPHSEFIFNAGQFVMGEFPDRHQAGKTVKRAYSISSSPFEKTKIELAITHVDNGNASNYIHENLKKGDSFLWKGPFGRFCLPENPTGRLIFIATGTGITPLRSMFRQLLHDHYLEPIFFFHGCRFDGTHPYFDEMISLTKEHANFHFFPILSKPEKWTGPKGYVQDLVKNNLTGTDGHIYLCGVGKMIEDNQKNLIDMGFSAAQIHVEKW